MAAKPKKPASLIRDEKITGKVYSGGTTKRKAPAEKKTKSKSARNKKIKSLKKKLTPGERAAFNETKKKADKMKEWPEHRLRKMAKKQAFSKKLRSVAQLTSTDARALNDRYYKEYDRLEDSPSAVDDKKMKNLMDGKKIDGTNARGKGLSLNVARSAVARHNIGKRRPVNPSGTVKTSRNQLD